MAFTRSLSDKGSGSAGSASVSTNAFDLAAGKLVVAGVKCEGAAGTIDSVTDTAGNTYLPLTGRSYAAGGEGRVRLFYCLSSIAQAGNVVTAAYSSGSSAFRYLYVQSYSYDGVASLVQENGNAGNSTSAASGSMTAGKLGVGVLGEFIGSTITAGSGWTETDSDPTMGGHFLDRIDDPGGSVDCTATVPNSYWGVAAATFTDSGADSTPPALSSPTATATSSSTATVGATTDEGNGTMYAVVDTVTTTPSAAELEAGQDGDGGAAIWSDSQSITTTGAKTFNVTGLAPNTAYSYFIGHKDAANNFSNIVGGTFTTDQRAMPSADVVDGTWTPSTGADLFAVLDENPSSDTDFISTQTAADSCTVSLASLTDPTSSAGHKVSYRLQGDGTSGVLVELLQGATVIASWTHDPAPSSVTQFDQTLSGAEADSITDYTALRVRFTEA